MKETDIQVFSKTDNLRLYIIEHTLHIETLVSEAIEHLLGIDYKTSKSFGYGSSALSFNQKIQIIQDIKGIESEMTKKLSCLMNIRNKFAHLQEIDSFENLFTLTSVGKEIEKQLVKWYSLDEMKVSDDEHKFRFFKLAEEITYMLILLQVETRTKNRVLEIEREFTEGNLKSYVEVVSGLENASEIQSKVFAKTSEKLPHLKIDRK
ncbi:hypothetical protein H5J24_15190 [Chryseobacterium capnotolerans]|uniref:hypothetical protein n=1 Tax=Chryseobacterium TaxID=59732 RepID=UPI000839DC28|nr:MULTISPECIES: hypothetical protein [Chryseobacterium]UHO37097.1 hypothetical protein H5J24_15190 [Chryseobacterium capnotolerans]